MSWFDEQLGGGGNALRNLPAVAGTQQRIAQGATPGTGGLGLVPTNTVPRNAKVINPAATPLGLARGDVTNKLPNEARVSYDATPSGPPTGGSLSDPAYVDRLIAYWANQPGVNPSVKNDPGYWRGRILQVGGDQDYWTGRFMQAEGPPEGAGDSASAASSLGPTAGNFSYPSFNKTFQAPQWTQTFQAPTGVDDSNDPGYTARLDAGLHAMENSAAAKGTLLTTGTQQEENQYAQDYASNEYGNVYNRALTTYGTNYQQFLNDYQQKLSQFQQDYGIYQGGFQNALATQQNNVGQNLQGAYLDLFGQNQNFSQQFSLANLGYTAAANSNANATQLAIAQANAALGGGASNASYLGNAGTITGAGGIAQGNNLAGAIGTIGNTALQSYYLQQLQNQSGYVAPKGPGFSGTGSFY